MKPTWVDYRELKEMLHNLEDYITVIRMDRYCICNSVFMMEKKTVTLQATYAPATVVYRV